MQTQFFRTPAMAFLYERGWRQNFNAAGFPGIDKEFAEAAEFFAPCADGGVVVDLSCGSGLMTRRLCRSGRYRRVLGLDYSEAMLGETSRRFDAEGAPRDALTLVRADAARLHAQSAVWAVPQLGSCASSGRTWQLWAVRCFQGETRPPGAQPPPRYAERAGSKATNSALLCSPQERPAGHSRV